VFFDGTGNNASNTAMGALCGAHHPIRPEDLDASCKPYMSDPESSYGNDVTNVKKLSDLYYVSRKVESDGPQKQAFRALYIDGIGTEAGKQDSLIGSGIGRGETGVAGRVQQAFRDVQFAIQRFRLDNPSSEITRLIFDIFGFSRGAAAARHFANELALGNRGPLKAVTQGEKKSFSRYFIGEYLHDIRVCSWLGWTWGRRASCRGGRAARADLRALAIGCRTTDLPSLDRDTGKRPADHAHCNSTAMR
jgi:hypothetical protein